MESIRDSEESTDAKGYSDIQDEGIRNRETRERLVEIERELCEYGAEFRNRLTEGQKVYKR